MRRVRIVGALAAVAVLTLGASACSSSKKASSSSTTALASRGDVKKFCGSYEAVNTQLGQLSAKVTAGDAKALEAYFAGLVSAVGALATVPEVDGAVKLEREFIAKTRDLFAKYQWDGQKALASTEFKALAADATYQKANSDLTVFLSGACTPAAPAVTTAPGAATTKPAPATT
jgi:hypothetical protein